VCSTCCEPMLLILVLLILDEVRCWLHQEDLHQEDLRVVSDVGWMSQKEFTTDLSHQDRNYPPLSVNQYGESCGILKRVLTTERRRVTWCRSATCFATRLDLPKRKSMTGRNKILIFVYFRGRSLVSLDIPSRKCEIQRRELVGP
jgi:hypothetical protein